MTTAKIVRTISPKVVKARCDSAREERKALASLPLTWQPFAKALANVKPSK